MSKKLYDYSTPDLNKEIKFNKDTIHSIGYLSYIKNFPYDSMENITIKKSKKTIVLKFIYRYNRFRGGDYDGDVMSMYPTIITGLSY